MKNVVMVAGATEGICFKSPIIRGMRNHFMSDIKQELKKPQTFLYYNKTDPIDNDSYTALLEEIIESFTTPESKKIWVLEKLPIGQLVTTLYVFGGLIPNSPSISLQKTTVHWFHLPGEEYLKDLQKRTALLKDYIHPPWFYYLFHINVMKRVLD
jgi:hypothetical protein